MKRESRKIVQIILAVAILAAVVRLALIYRGRQAADRVQQGPNEQAINPDYYVVPRRLHAYDLATARELTKQPVWVKEGYRYTYYRYDFARKRALLDKGAGTLGPIEKLEVVDVRMQPTPGDPRLKQMLAIFRRDGNDFAVPVGAEQRGTYLINADEMFFYQDPRKLYEHWPKEVWDAIERHEVKQGMNEIQASFAIGMGIPQAGGGEDKTVQYPNGGNPFTVIYRRGRAVEIKPAKGADTNDGGPLELRTAGLPGYPSVTHDPAALSFPASA